MNLLLHRRESGLITLLVGLGIACTCSTTSLLGGATPSSQAPQATGSSLPTPSAPEATTTAKLELQTAESVGGVEGLRPEAPWIIVSTSNGLWAANSDGANLVQLIANPRRDINLQESISSSAHQIAFLSSGADPYHGLTLQMISLPDGKVHKLTALTTPSTEPDADAAPGDPSLEAMRAVVEQPSFAWSPDGKKLAFIGALDSPKADVYVYNLLNKKIQKVSGDAGQDFWPTWTPDGDSILYFSAEGFGSGAGIAMQGIWLAAADGSGSRLLTASTSGGEQMLGWRDSETAVLASFDPGGGSMNRLRLVNIQTKKQTILHAGQSYGAAVASGIQADAGSLLFFKSDGLYLFTKEDANPHKISSEQSAQIGKPPPIQWKEDERVFVVHFQGDRLSTFMADGSHREDAPFNPASGKTDVSAFGMIWGWTAKGSESEGVWISGPGLETTQISSLPASAPLWNLENDLLFFIDQDLYRSTFNSHYSDTAKIGSLTGNVLEAAWMGFGEALDKKYGQ
jgi:hypothetical protein